MTGPKAPGGAGGARVVGVMALGVLLAAGLVVLGAREARRAARPPDAVTPWPAPGDPVDTALARAGGVVFGRACAACHALGTEAGAGPGLAGLLERRDSAWIRGMVLTPDSMLRVDPEARALLATWRVPMPAVGIGPVELRAVIEHVRAAGGVSPGR